jgi:hypothetical protein
MYQNVLLVTVVGRLLHYDLSMNHYYYYFDSVADLKQKRFFKLKQKKKSIQYTRVVGQADG